MDPINDVVPVENSRSSWLTVTCQSKLNANAQKIARIADEGRTVSIELALALINIHRSNNNNKITTFQQATTGGSCCAGIIFLSLGITCLIVGVRDRREHEAPDCGKDGRPPLRDWIYGTGVAFMILLLLSCLVASKVVSGQLDGSPLQKVLTRIIFTAAGLMSFFHFAWTIAGAFSLWRDGDDCRDANPQIWNVGMATVILSLIGLCCSCGSSGGQFIQIEEKQEVRAVENA